MAMSVPYGELHLSATAEKIDAIQRELSKLPRYCREQCDRSITPEECADERCPLWPLRRRDG